MNNFDKFKLDFSALLENLKELNDKFQIDPELLNKSIDFTNTSAYMLSTCGWYIAFNMIYEDVFKVFIAIKNSNFYEAENAIMKYYKENLDSIEDYLIQRHPEREKVLKEAFMTHRQGLYCASVILFISQADGICKGKLFRKTDKLINFLEPMRHSSLLRATLANNTAINKDTRDDKSDFFSKLNRHGVVHGIHLDYGSEKNSFKALSLLNFSSDFVR